MRGWIAVLFLLFSPPLWAGVTILSPVTGSVTARERVRLIIKGPLKGMKVQSEGETPPLRLVRKVPLKAGGAVYHFEYTLVPGKNRLLLEPGGVRFVIKRVPSASRRRFLKSRYRFHRASLEQSCRPCHHLLEKEKKSGTKLFTCSPCHERPRCFVKRGMWVHGPYALERCFTCHNPRFSKTGVRFVPYEGGGDELCFRCHVTSRRWKRMTHVHGPVGARNCGFCHNPHASTQRFYLKFGGGEALCLECHKNKAREFSVHGYRFHAILEVEGCTVCHDPHASNKEYQLHRGIRALCVGCHPGFRGMRKGHPISNHPLEAPKDPLHPQKRFTCVSCHDPHGSPYVYLLIAPQGRGLCSRCHPY